MNEEDSTVNQKISIEFQKYWMDLDAQRLVLRSQGKAPTAVYETRHAGQAIIPGAWGAVIPDGIMVLDVDVKDDKPGLEELERLRKDLGSDLLTNTLIVDTPSGGLHIYLRIPAGFRTGNVVRGYNGLDIKGPGKNYVVGPGSYVEYQDRAGEWIKGAYHPRSDPDIGMLHAPSELVGLVTPRSIAVGPDVVDDSDEAIDRFRQHCERHMEAHGAHQRFQLAQFGADHGLSMASTMEVMHSYGFGPETEMKVEHAYTYRQNPIGNKTAESLFDDEIDPDSVAKHPADSGVKPSTKNIPYFINSRLLKAKQPDWLIDGVLEADTMALLVAAPASYKSFLALDWAMSIASGISWHDHDVADAQPVVFIPAEGEAGMLRRRDAWIEHHGVDPEHFYFPDPEQARRQQFKLPNDDLMVRIEEFLEHIPTPPRLIVLDTLARTLDGNENSNSEVGAYIQAADQLRAKWSGCTVLIVHHFGKDERQGARGASALHAGVNAEYHLTKQTDDNLSVVMYCAKMKDALEPEPLTLTMQVVDIVVDGEPDSNLVVGSVELKSGFEVVKPESEAKLRGLLLAIKSGQSKSDYALSIGHTNPSNHAFNKVYKLAIDSGYLESAGKGKPLNLTLRGEAYLSGEDKPLNSKLFE